MAPQTRCGAASIVSSSTIADIVVPFCFHVASPLYLTYRLSIEEKGNFVKGVPRLSTLLLCLVLSCGARARTERQKSRWGEERTSASASSRDGQPVPASARCSGVLSRSWVSTTSVTAPWSRKSSVTTVSRPGVAPLDQVKTNCSGDRKSTRLNSSH